MRRRLLRLSLLLLLSAAVTAPGVAATESMRVGSPSPAYAAEALDGGPASLESLRGSVVLLNVWATWCPSCRVEIPYLAQLHAESAARGLGVIGISIDESSDRAQVVAAAPALGINYPIWLDPDDRIGRLYRSNGLPASVLIDRAGVVRWRHEGILRATTPGWQAALDAALADAPRD